ncbi:MAG: HNH endonuclease [Desulfurivibrionaceae bacterium]
MTSLETYIKQFSRLRRAPRGGWSEATRNRAPHKPILLLAVLDLVARGVITTPFLEVAGDLVELNELFNGYWRRIVSPSQTSSIAFPFSRLHNEPFWALVPLPGKEISPTVINNISSVSQLRMVALGGRLDDDLFQFMRQPESRNNLREILLHSCFSEQARAELTEQVAINAEAYSYSQELVRKAHLPKVEEVLPTYRAAARDQGFRRIVVSTYDHRCALCGVRIITPEGHTVVDAAHIVPWSRTQNDDICNGMALCKLCHWSFDEGMMGMSDSYDVIVSRQIVVNSNVPGFIVMLAGRTALLPLDPDLWPAKEYLAEHRREWRL